MKAAILNREDLKLDVTTRDFEGKVYGAEVSFIWVDMQPGQGPRLHRHAYDEIIIILDGAGTYRLGDQTMQAHGGQVVLIPAGVAHAFTNTGSGVLRQVDIHASAHILTEWLE